PPALRADHPLPPALEHRVEGVEYRLVASVHVARKAESARRLQESEAVHGAAQRPCRVHEILSLDPVAAQHRRVGREGMPHDHRRPTEPLDERERVLAHRPLTGTLVTSRAWSTARIASVRSSRTAASPSAARPSAGAPTTLVSPAGISSAS